MSHFMMNWRIRMVMTCKNPQGCKPHPFQDKEYGRGVRVHNVRGLGGNSGTRCTVCGYSDNSKAKKDSSVVK